MCSKPTLNGVCEWDNLQLAPAPPMYRPFVIMEEEAGPKKKSKAAQIREKIGELNAFLIICNSEATRISGMIFPEADILLNFFKKIFCSMLTQFVELNEHFHQFCSSSFFTTVKIYVHQGCLRSFIKQVSENYDCICLTFPSLFVSFLSYLKMSSNIQKVSTLKVSLSISNLIIFACKLI